MSQLLFSLPLLLPATPPLVSLQKRAGLPATKHGTSLPSYQGRARQPSRRTRDKRQPLLLMLGVPHEHQVTQPCTHAASLTASSVSMRLNEPRLVESGGVGGTFIYFIRFLPFEFGAILGLWAILPLGPGPPPGSVRGELPLVARVSLAGLSHNATHCRWKVLWLGLCTNPSTQVFCGYKRCGSGSRPPLLGVLARVILGECPS